MRKIIPSSFGVILLVLIAFIAPTSAKSTKECSSSGGTRMCVTATPSGSNFRVSVEWVYDTARNVNVPRPVKRTVWAMNVLCGSRWGRVDTVNFYDSSNKIIFLTPTMLSNIASGLQANAAPKIIRLLCD
jgi:hypothetical protein